MMIFLCNGFSLKEGTNWSLAWTLCYKISSHIIFIYRKNELNNKLSLISLWLCYTGDWMYFHTREHGFDVPGWDGVNEGVHIEHDYRDGEAVGVSLHRAGVGVVPLDTHTLFLILWEILTAEAKGYGGQEALRKRGQNTSVRTQGQKQFQRQASFFRHSRRRLGF